MDYQVAEVGREGAGHTGMLTQQYYVRLVDRLFYKNQLTLAGNFQYRAGRRGEPVDFRPFYELRLSSYAYGLQLAYEPYTIRQRTEVGREQNRRWRGSAYTQPDGWPRLTYDFQRARRTLAGAGRAQEHLDSYRLSWEPRGVVMSGGYSRQRRASPNSPGELLEVYRLSGSANRSLPAHHQVSASYAFDRTWRRHATTKLSAQNQHTVAASVSGQPATVIGWFGQYSGRFIHLSRPQGAENAANHLASGMASFTPRPEFTIAAGRHFEAYGSRAGQRDRHTDYWELRATAQGRFFRQIHATASGYRLAYVGAARGTRYSDTYFLALRGPVRRYADLSGEVSLSDQHGRVKERFSGNVNSFAMLRPTRDVQCQIGYTVMMRGKQMDLLTFAEESITANVQFTPTADFSLGVVPSLRRNRTLSSIWDASWSIMTSYRWPSFANISINYSQQRTSVISALNAAQGASAKRAVLMLDASWQVGPQTSFFAQYNRQMREGSPDQRAWGLGLLTQF